MSSHSVATVFKRKMSYALFSCCCCDKNTLIIVLNDLTMLTYPISPLISTGLGLACAFRVPRSTVIIASTSSPATVSTSSTSLLTVETMSNPFRVQISSRMYRLVAIVILTIVASVTTTATAVVASSTTTAAIISTSTLVKRQTESFSVQFALLAPVSSLSISD